MLRHIVDSDIFYAVIFFSVRFKAYSNLYFSKLVSNRASPSCMMTHDGDV